MKMGQHLTAPVPTQVVAPRAAAALGMLAAMALAARARVIGASGKSR